MKDLSLANLYLAELQAEVPATRQCLERISRDTFDYKPHEKSMQMGYLTILVADIPRWVTSIIEESVIDLATYSRWDFSSTEELLQHFDDNVRGAEAALQKMKAEDFAGTFELKVKGQLMYSQSMQEAIGSTLNHWVHHRGELVVYMRLNDILIPSIYGPSADTKSFG